MSTSVEASELIKRLVEPAPVGSNIEVLIRVAARKVGLPFGRAKKLWYREIRAVRADEMDALRAAVNATRTEAEDETRRKYREVVARIERLEHRLAQERPDLVGE